MSPPETNEKHDRFIELAAVSMADALTTGEAAELADHLAACEACREVYRQYQVLTTEGLPLLAAHCDYSTDKEWEANSGRIGITGGITKGQDEPDSRPVPRWSGRPTSAAKPGLARGILRAAPQAALAACLIAGVAVACWRIASQRTATVNTADAAARRRILALQSAKTSADALLFTQAQTIARLKTESQAKISDLQMLKNELRTLQEREKSEGSAARAEQERLLAERAAADEQLHNLSRERDRLLEKFREISETAQNVQSELARARSERDQAMGRAGLLETQLKELAATVQDQQHRLSNSENYLSADRDIRELIGARNLYIADVFDVDSSSGTRRPYGRVFYTRGKQLVFYAFDLDREAKVTTASAFQVWGEKERAAGERTQPQNLGILYEDSESKRRWILRFDDSRTLAEIDAVFVTVEPRGGSVKPTGKPFLFAMLRREANHP